MIMGFQYSLDSVLEYRKKIEDNKKEKFMMENKEFLDETNLLEGIYDTYNKAMQELKSKVKFSLEEQKSYMQYITNLQKKMETQRIRVSDCSRKCDMARLELGHAQKDRKIMEKLEEKELSRYKKETKQKEEKELNEIASIEYVRRMNAK